MGRKRHDTGNREINTQKWLAAPDEKYDLAAELDVAISRLSQLVDHGWTPDEMGRAAKRVAEAARAIDDYVAGLPSPSLKRRHRVPSDARGRIWLGTVASE